MTINFNFHAHPDRRLVHVGYDVTDDRILDHYVYDWTEYIRGIHDGSIVSEKIGTEIWDHCFSAYFDGESWYLASWEVLTDCDVNEVWVWPADDAPSFDYDDPDELDEILVWVLKNRHEK